MKLHKDGDSFFIARNDFVDLATSPAVFLSEDDCETVRSYGGEMRGVSWFVLLDAYLTLYPERDDV